MVAENHTEEKGDCSREEQREKQLIKDQNPGGKWYFYFINDIWLLRRFTSVSY